MPGLQTSRKRPYPITYSASKTPVQVQPAQAICFRSEIYSAFSVKIIEASVPSAFCIIKVSISTTAFSIIGI